MRVTPWSFVVCRPALYLLKTLFHAFDAETVDLVVWAAVCPLTQEGLAARSDP